MPWLFVLFITVFVNFSSFVYAQEYSTQIRGPRGAERESLAQSTTQPATQPSTIVDTIGPLTPVDTLWRVADKVRPEPSVSLYQVMYALYLKNPDAFIDNNLNHLKPNAVLVIPSAQEIRQVDAVLARNKSEQDDKAWAQKQRQGLSSTKAGTGQTATNTTLNANTLSAANNSASTVSDNTVAQSASSTNAPKVAGIATLQGAKTPVDAKANEPLSSAQQVQLQAELKRVNEASKQELDSLRTQFADSMQLVESMLQENLQLKTSLAKVQQELGMLKAELGEDSELQQQIDKLIAQQGELIQAKVEQEAKASGAEKTSGSWLSHPLTWVLAACVPALLILLAVLYFVKQRGKQTEEVVKAAREQEQPDPAYSSPLPPLDENDNLDESLFDLDDSLLDEGFEEETVLIEDDPIDDALTEFDDSFSLDDKSASPVAVAALGAKAASEFDVNNILSSSDLSALFAEDESKVVDITSAQKTNDNIALVSDDDTFDVDDLIEEISLDEEDEELAQLTQAERSMLGDMEDDNTFNEDAINDAQAQLDSLVSETKQDEADYDFDNSELAQFAESLVAEGIEKEKAASSVLDNFDDLIDDEAELAKLLGQVERLPAEESNDEDDFISSTTDSIYEEMLAEMTSEAQPITEDAWLSEVAKANENDHALTDALLSADALDDVVKDYDEQENALALQDFKAEPESLEQLEEDTLFEPDLVVDLDVLDDDILLDAGLSNTDDITDIINEIANRHDVNETDNEDGFGLVDENVVPAFNGDLDLNAKEDDSIAPLTDAALSVENPSKILDEYPDLELNDSVENTELTSLDEVEFESLMSQLEEVADSADSTELQSEDTLELVTDKQSETEDSSFDFTDDDFVEIDKLLANAEQQEQDTERFNNLNVDVGLDEFADIIGEHDRRDVDLDDNGFAAKLDLVRAYIEIEDKESAQMLLDDIIASDAPDNVKSEALKLKDA